MRARDCCASSGDRRGRHPDELAADLIEVWSAVEASLRALVGGSALGGVPLVTALRSRGLLSLDQAHALVNFAAVRERAQATDYQPTAADAEAGRHAFTLLHEGLGGAAAVPSDALSQGDASLRTGAAAPFTPPGSAAPASPGAAGRSEEATHAPAGHGGHTRRGALQRNRGAIAVAGLVVAAAVVALGWWLLVPREPAGLGRGIALYAAGQLDAAAAELSRVVVARPRLALPHIYLGRIARERGDPGTAGRELARAVELEPANALAQRELGSFFMAQGQYDAARRRYVRAVQLDPSDPIAQGYLGCTLVRLGRADLATAWLARAGSGPWQACAPGGASPGAGGAAAPRS